MKHQAGGETATDDMLVPPPLVPRPHAFWGAWATIGLTVVILLVASVAGGIASAPVLMLTLMASPTPTLTSLMANGLLLSVNTIVFAPFAVGLTVLAVKLRKGVDLREALALRWPSGRQAAFWIAVFAGFLATLDGLKTAVGLDVVPSFMTMAYATSGWPPLLFLALIVCAPIAEEVLFRGFMLRGLLNSRLGAVGAVALSSLAWASLHVQYDLHVIAEILLLGIVLGIARLATRSLLLVVMIHALVNAVASAELLVKVHLLD